VLDALAAFKEGAGPVLTRADAESLGAAYLLLRRVENRVRMNRGTSGSRVPNDPSARDDLAARLGLEGSLREMVDEAMSGVRSVYRVVLDKLK
jgi:glutamine synthetase adenylyltransferase